MSTHLRIVLLTLALAGTVANPAAALAVEAIFVDHTLFVEGDDFPNDIEIAVVGGQIQVTNNGVIVTIQIRGRRDPNTLFLQLRRVVVNGKGGDDTFALDASLGTAPAVLDGGGGNDTLTANHRGNTVLYGGAGNDILNGGGNDLLVGGEGNDSLNGGAGADSLFGGAGSDTCDGGGKDGEQDILACGEGADIFVRYAGESDIVSGFDANEGDLFEDLP